jgi:hypothetical protein
MDNTEKARMIEPKKKKMNFFEILTFLAIDPRNKIKPIEGR